MTASEIARVTGREATADIEVEFVYPGEMPAVFHLRNVFGGFVECVEFPELQAVAPAGDSQAVEAIRRSVAEIAQVAPQHVELVWEDTEESSVPTAAS